YLKRTEWVLAGASKQQLIEKARAAFADHTFVAPEAGSFSFMLSKQGYLSDVGAGPWLPHVMLFVPHGQAAIWGASLEGSPILGAAGHRVKPTVLFIPVRGWSAGTPPPPLPPPEKHEHKTLPLGREMNRLQLSRRSPHILS